MQNGEQLGGGHNCDEKSMLKNAGLRSMHCQNEGSEPVGLRAMMQSWRKDSLPPTPPRELARRVDPANCAGIHRRSEGIPIFERNDNTQGHTIVEHTRSSKRQ